MVLIDHLGSRWGKTTQLFHDAFPIFGMEFEECFFSSCRYCYLAQPSQHRRGDFPFADIVE